MRAHLRRVIATAICLTPLPTLADECWAVTNIKGYSSYADDEYRFSQDGLPSAVVLCFTDEGGSVTGTDTRMVKFGNSTLAGFASNKDIELFEIYQLDREKKKVLYTKSRIGTKSVAPTLSDVVSSFVGDASVIGQ